MPLSQADFVTLLIQAQPKLFGFIGRLVVDRSDTEDVLQETNLALWKMADQFQEGTNFVAWACSVAHYRVLEHRTAAKKFRVRLADKMLELLVSVSLDDNRLDSLVAEEQFERRRRALATCLDQIPERNRDLLIDYYERGRSFGEIAVMLGKNSNAVAQLFHRMRTMLRACVKGKLAGAEP